MCGCKDCKELVTSMPSSTIDFVYCAVGVCSWLKILWPPCVPVPCWLQMACFSLFRYLLAALWRHKSVVIYLRLLVKLHDHVRSTHEQCMGPTLQVLQVTWDSKECNQSREQHHALLEVKKTSCWA